MGTIGTLLSGKNGSYAAASDPRVAAHWGFFATIAFGLLIVFVFFIVQAIAVLVAARTAGGPLSVVEIREIFASAADNGYFLTIATLATTLVCGGLLIGVIKLKRGADLREYLSLRTVPARTMLAWMAIVVVLLVAWDVVTVSLGRDILPEFMRNAYATARPMWLLWVALIIAAPLFEEMLFRGFLLKGLEGTFLRPAGAIVVTAAVWSIIHNQYDAYNLAQVFLLGLIFGTARITTGSLLVPFGLHALTNLGATIEVAVLG